MGCNSEFERAFMDRSLVLVKQYEGSYDATLLLNCLLGLLVVPNERCLDSIPTDPIDDLRKWGISPDAIQDCGRSQGIDAPTTLRGLVKHLRNAVAHSRFKPDPDRGEVEAFCFHDKSGFRARVKLSELREFVERLAEKLKAM